VTNILLIIADDHRYCDSSAYGNSEIRTPHLERLAGEGLRGVRHSTPSPICAPARMALYSGLYPVRNGGYPNHSYSYPKVRSITRHLQKLGYRTGLHGKTHIAPRKVYAFEKVDDPREFMTRDPAQPFFLAVAFTEPHTPWGRHDHPARPGAEFTLPPHLLDSPFTREGYAAYVSDVEVLDRKVGEVLAALKSAGQADNTMVIYTGDHGAQFPGSKWTCYEEGLRVPMIVRWPGVIEPGRVTDAITQHVDLAPTFVEIAGGDPSAIDCGMPNTKGHPGFCGTSLLPLWKGESDSHREYAFGLNTQNKTVGGCVYPIRSIASERYKLILNLNHAQRFSCALTEPVGDNRHGNHYLPEWEKRAAEGDARAQFLTQRFFQRPAVELYDLEHDPHEMTNLAEDPSLREVRELLETRLLDWMQEQGDKGMETELEALKHQGLAWSD